MAIGAFTQRRFGLLFLLCITLASTLAIDLLHRRLDRVWIGRVASFEDILPSENIVVDDLLEQAKDLLGRGEWSKSLAACEEALQLASSYRLEALAWNCKGRVFQKQRPNEKNLELTSYAQALAFYETALKISEQHGDHTGAAFTQYNIGTVFTALGENKFAMDRFERSFQNREKERDLSITLMEIATLNDLNGDHNLAISQLRDAFKMAMSSSDRSPNSRLPDKAAILDRLGTALANEDYFAESQRAFHSALEIYQRLGSLLYAAVTRGNLGWVNLLRCKSEQTESTPCDVEPAIAQFRTALGEFEQFEEEPYHFQALFHFRLAQALRYQGRLADATDMLLKALHVVESIRSGTPYSLFRTSFLARHAVIYEELILTLMQRNRQDLRGGHALAALAVAEKLRARDLLERLQDVRELSSEANSSHPLQSLNALEHQRLLAVQQGAPPQELARIERLLHDQQLELDWGPGITLPPAPFDLKLDLPDLEENTLLLFFSLGEEESFLWALESSSTEAFTLPPGPKIKKKAEEVYDRLSTSDQRFWAKGGEDMLRRLSEDLLGQVAPLLQHQKLLIVLDGPLESIPFSMLENPLTGRHLGDDHEIVRWPSLAISAYFRDQQRRDLREDQASATKKIVVFANPDYAWNEPRAESTDPSLMLPPPVPLKHSQQEARAILSHFKPQASRAYLGAQASREAILEGALEGYRIVHLSAHTELNDTRPEFSQLILSSVDPAGNATNGRLFLHEIDDLKLDCDLIVLSACNTAIGQEMRGEGMLSMTRAVLAAGARRAVVSLWYVDDAATSAFMAHFYHAMIHEGQAPSSALQWAQRKIRKEEGWEAPYYWAAFVLVGD